MKIEPNAANVDPAAAKLVEKAVGLGAPGASRAAQATGDAVHLSPEARLVTEAREVANDLPIVRVDVVAKLRERFEAGQVGQDPAALADAIIDDLLGE